MIRFVLDASVSLRWFLDASVPLYAIRVKQLLIGGAVAVVPALWHLEMANGLVVAQRRGILTAGDIDRSLLYLEQLLAQVIGSDPALISVRQSLATAQEFQLSSYVASYLETARRDNLPLATLDQPLRAAARKAGVELLM
ncbi:MAG: type II toxin-antitoxin system VapC family toxin [Candidatus Acidiferrales bacterium]